MEPKMKNLAPIIDKCDMSHPLEVALIPQSPLLHYCYKMHIESVCRCVWKLHCVKLTTLFGTLEIL